MIHLHVISFGHSRTSSYEKIIDDYIKKIQRWATIDFYYPKFNNSIQLPNHLKNHSTIIFDQRGKSLDSLSFANLAFDQIIQGRSHLNCVIGPPEGFKHIEKNLLSISLSNLTLPHEMAKLLIIEQLYRMFALIHHHPYAK